MKKYLLILFLLSLVLSACAGLGQQVPIPITKGDATALPTFQSPPPPTMTPTPIPAIKMFTGQVITLQDAQGRMIAIQYLGFANGFVCVTNNPQYSDLTEKEKKESDPYDCFASSPEVDHEVFTWGKGYIVGSANGGPEIYIKAGWDVVLPDHPLMP